MQPDHSTALTVTVAWLASYKGTDAADTYVVLWADSMDCARKGYRHSKANALARTQEHKPKL